MPFSLRALHQNIRHTAFLARWSANPATFMRLRLPRQGPQTLHTRLHGRRLRVAVRGGTSDAWLATQILSADSEYRLPIHLQPRIIFDVGANIGLTSLYFAAAYPNARIYAFEPLPENLKLLQRNVEPFADRITVIDKGLGRRPGWFEFHPSDDPLNHGGGTFHAVGCNPAKTIRLPVTTIEGVCEQHGIDRIDVLKLDAEGAELDVLRGAPAELLRDVQVVIGELHGVDDLEVLSMLQLTHDLGYRKLHDRRCYPFVAVQKNRTSVAGASAAA